MVCLTMIIITRIIRTDNSSEKFQKELKEIKEKLYKHHQIICDFGHEISSITESIHQLEITSAK